MKVYKITYVNNMPILCNWVMGRVIKGEYTYEYNNGNLIFAFVNANDDEEAQEIGKDISVKFLENTGLLIQ